MRKLHPSQEVASLGWVQSGARCPRRAKSLKAMKMLSGERTGLSSRLAAGTRRQRVQLWQLKCRFGIKRVALVISFAFELRSPSVCKPDRTGLVQGLVEKTSFFFLVQWVLGLSGAS